jgi:hypothetical protein
MIKEVPIITRRRPAPTLTLSTHFDASAENNDNIIQMREYAVSAVRTKPGAIDELPICSVKLAKRTWNARGPFCDHDDGQST